MLLLQHIVTIDNVQIVRFANQRQWSLHSNTKFANVGADEIKDKAVRYDGAEDELLSARTGLNDDITRAL